MDWTLFWTWDGWTAIGTLATCILAAGVFLAFWQIFQARHMAKIDFTEKRLETLNQSEFKRGLQIAFEKRPSKLSELNTNERELVDQAFEYMQTLGLLVENKYADKTLSIEAHRGKFIRTWCLLQTCICNERQNRGKFGEGIEYLAKEAYKYQQKKFPEDKWVKFNSKICYFNVKKSCEDISEDN